MVRDPLLWLMLGGGISLLIWIIFLELTRMSGWIDDPNHDLALVFGIGIAVASLYYAHSRKDHLDTNETLDEIHKDTQKIKKDIQKIKEDFRSKEKK